MNKVSVIMSTYKEPIDWIRQSVDSVLNQTYRELEFIIVVDNPEYKELISVLNDYAKADDRISIIINENNMGLVKSLNKALLRCNGKYIARMDADDISLPERIAHQIDYMNNKQYDLVGCFYEVFYEDKPLRIVRWAKTQEVCGKILKYKNCVPHPAWLARKKVFDSLGGYREFDACEDYDFLIRASLAGYKIGNTPEVLLRYRDNPKSITHKKSGIQYSITQLITENFRNGRETGIEEYQSYLKDSEHEKLSAVYKAIEDIDRKRSQSHNSVYKTICLCRLLCFREYRKIRWILYMIKRWKKTERV